MGRKWGRSEGNRDTVCNRGLVMMVGRYEVGQWKPLVSLVRTTHYATLIPMLCADRNRNSHHH